MSLPLYSLKLVTETQSEFAEPIYYDGSLKPLRPFLEKHFTGLDKERSGCFLLDAQQRIIGFHLLHIGTRRQTFACDYELFKITAISNADGFIRVHNHPAGSPYPSEADRRSHKRFQETSKRFDVRYHDNLIVAGDGNIFSFNDEAAAKDIDYGLSEKEKAVLLARQKIKAGHGNSSDVVLVCHDKFDKLYQAANMKETLADIATDLEQVVNSSRAIRQKTRHEARVLLEVVKASAPMVEAGYRPPSLKFK